MRVAAHTLLEAATADLAAAGVSSPALDARVLLADALGIAPTTLLLEPHRGVDQLAVRRFRLRLARRVAREPISRIRGVREFWSLPFAIAPSVLDPRPDSETLVEQVLKLAPAPARVLDLGTGSGCLLLAVLHERPQSFGVGVDQSAKALWMARKNAEALGLAARCHFGQGGWRAVGEPLHLPRHNAPFDVILSNPPYIASEEIPGLDPEVKDFDPITALDGGPDGLEPYRAILGGLRPFLAPGGLVAVEIGWTQAAAVSALFEAAGLRAITVTQDLGGRDRVVTGRG